MILHFLMMWACGVAAQLPQAQVVALRAVYAALGCTSTIKCPQVTSICPTSTSISCSATSVTRISLPSAGLTGSLASQLGQLTGLTSLDLSRNSIFGTMPSTMVRLTRLATLRLDGNQLTGDIVLPSAALNICTLQSIGTETNCLNCLSTTSRCTCESNAACVNAPITNATSPIPTDAPTPPPPTPPTAAMPVCFGCQPNQLRNCAAIKCGADPGACRQTDEQKSCIAAVYAGCEQFVADDKCNGDPLCCPSSGSRIGLSLLVLGLLLL